MPGEIKMKKIVSLTKTKGFQKAHWDFRVVALSWKELCPNGMAPLIILFKLVLLVLLIIFLATQDSKTELR